MIVHMLVSQYVWNNFTAEVKRWKVLKPETEDVLAVSKENQTATGLELLSIHRSYQLPTYSSPNVSFLNTSATRHPNFMIYGVINVVITVIV